MFLKVCLASLCFFFASVSLAAQPAWISNPYINHNRQAYIAAVGSGNSHQSAERDALRGIASVFGLDIHAVESITMLYREVVTDGGAAWTESTDFSSEIQSSVRMENLMGASAAARWDDGRGSHFVLAVLHRGTAVILYSNRIQANQDIIRNLTNMTTAQRNSLDGFARYQTAAAFADMNVTYGEILVALGAPWHEMLVRGDDFRRRAREAARSTPISINVRGVDNIAAARIQGAFADVLNEFGFVTTGANARIALNVDVTTRRIERGSLNPLPGVSAHTWIDMFMDITANLVELGTGIVLLPYDFSVHRQIGDERQRPGAESAAIDEAARRIRNEYGNRLARLVPRR